MSRASQLYLQDDFATLIDQVCNHPIKGLEIYFSHQEVVTLDEHIENAEGAAFDADEAAATAMVFIAAGTSGGGAVVLSADDVAALRQMLGRIKDLTAITREATGAMSLSRHAW